MTTTRVRRLIAALLAAAVLFAAPGPAAAAVTIEWRHTYPHKCQTCSVAYASLLVAFPAGRRFSFAAVCKRNPARFGRYVDVLIAEYDALGRPAGRNLAVRRFRRAGWHAFVVRAPRGFRLIQVFIKSRACAWTATVYHHHVDPMGVLA